MQHRTHRAAVAVLAVAILAGCSQAAAPAESAEAPAQVDAVEGGELSRLTLTERAAERLDIQTAPVEQVAGSSGTTVPYAAVLYAPDGVTWVYISTDPLTYVRELVVVDRIEGELAVLSDGPSVGTQVVTVGVAELYGTEFEVGH